MKSRIKTIIVFVIFGVLFLSVRAASQTNPDNAVNTETSRMLREKKVYGYLNQTLLREFAKEYSKISGIRIVLTQEVNNLLDIAVDVHDDSGVTKPMSEVLDSVISFVNKQYKLNLEWKVIDGIVVIKKVNGSTVLSENSAPVN